jgi:ABC-type transport system involved in cytochrome bd biosynthesis fused ATPase/permease subunit
MVALNRVRSFLLSNEHKSVGPGDLKDIGVEMKGLTAAYDSKRPNVDAETKELADAEWDLALVRSQLDDAEKRIQELSGADESMLVRVEQEAQPSNLLCLKRIDFECKRGELIAVVGSVGCGKSSFINAILGEVRELAGTVAVKGDLAYFAQSPFILNATVRDNILFSHVSEKVDEDLYQRAIDSCALKHDLELLSGMYM